MLLADLIADAVARPGYGGGLHREQLATMVKRHAWRDPMFKAALMYAYRRGKIDFCQGYVVQPPCKTAVELPGGEAAFLSDEPVPGEVVDGFWVPGALYGPST